MCVFFFSSRRRHTRWTGDWTSDVCSSDLTAIGLNQSTIVASGKTFTVQGITLVKTTANAAFQVQNTGGTETLTVDTSRSEERRVGKECRSRWSPDNEKEKRRAKKKSTNM